MKRDLKPAARWVVMVVSVIDVLAAAVTLALTWTAANAETRLPVRIDESVTVGVALLFGMVVFLIGWRGADRASNLILALAFAFAETNETLYILLSELRANHTIRTAVNLPTFVLGAGFFILAAARFPRTLTPGDISSSRTIWGRIKPLRAILIFFLHAWAVWIFIAMTEIFTALLGNPILGSAFWIIIVLLGLIYFYLMYRSGDEETRKKVLWLLELTLVSLVLRVVWLSADAVLHDNVSKTLRDVILVAIDSVIAIAQIFCFCMAVFYAGAISPTLVIRKTFVYGVTVALLLFTYATAEAFLVNFLVDKTGISDRFASAFLGTVLALAFHPIKTRMEHALKRFANLDGTKRNRFAPATADVSRQA
jgi:hypothetical protein